jgi:TonB family protein
MYKTLFILLVVFLSGCSIPEQELTVDTYPQLIEITSLPDLPYPITGIDFKLNTRFLLSEKGEVLAVKIINSNWDSDWDSMAVQQLRKWKFTPAVLDGKPISIWIKQPVIIRTMEQTLYTLAELVCNDERLIDSLYVLLRAGERFDLIVKNHSVSKSKENSGLIGRVDIKTFQYIVQSAIRKLKEGEISPPVKVGNLFYIYKRLSDKPRI